MGCNPQPRPEVNTALPIGGVKGGDCPACNPNKRLAILSEKAGRISDKNRGHYLAQLIDKSQ
jgi:hypothetical protein